MNPHFLRGHLLLQQERFEQAAAELGQAVAVEPDNAFFLSMLARAQLNAGRPQQALETARTALVKDPASGFAHWTLALVLTERGERSDAKAAIQRAIEIEPDDANNHGLLARILIEQRAYPAALEAANTGLSLDAKNEGCLTLRARALQALGRDEEAQRDAEALLADAPEDAWNHCLRGDQLLGAGQHEQARRHYIEALRIDPGHEGARLGLITSLKARSPLYSGMLRSLLWLERFSNWSLWIAIITIVVLFRAGDAWVRNHPDAIVPYEAVKALLYGACVLLVIANPVFNLLLRFDRDGRHALTEDEIKASNWHLACFGFAALCALWALAARTGYLPRTMGFTALYFTRAVSEVFEATPGYVRKRMALFALIAAGLLVLTPFVLVAALLILVKVRESGAGIPLLKTAIWIPVAVIGFACFADNIREWLERRRPDTR